MGLGVGHTTASDRIHAGTRPRVTQVSFLQMITRPAVVPLEDENAEDHVAGISEDASFPKVTYPRSAFSRSRGDVY